MRKKYKFKRNYIISLILLIVSIELSASTIEEYKKYIGEYTPASAYKFEMGKKQEYCADNLTIKEINNMEQETMLEVIADGSFLINLNRDNIRFVDTEHKELILDIPPYRTRILFINRDTISVEMIIYDDLATEGISYYALITYEKIIPR